MSRICQTVFLFISGRPLQAWEKSSNFGFQRRGMTAGGERIQNVNLSPVLISILVIRSSTFNFPPRPGPFYLRALSLRCVSPTNHPLGCFVLIILLGSSVPSEKQNSTSC
jgi:hypothetical protein